MPRWTRAVCVGSALAWLLTGTAFGLTCDELKAEIARLRQTLANEQAQLANCNNHLGTCTPGQVSGIQQAIQIAQQEIAADEAQLQTACAPPPPPNVDHVSVQGIEVVQAVQDIGNSVVLIAGKTTWVRVYLQKNNGTRAVTGVLKASRGGTTLTLNPAANITVDAADTLTQRRQTWGKSLNFAVPASMISSGTTIFSLGPLTDKSGAGKTIVCDNCGNPTQVSFSNAPPVLIRAVDMSYQFTPATPPGAPVQTANTRPIDFTLLNSWLGRAYPTATVTFSQTSLPLNFVPVFDGTATDCTKANAQLFFLRAQELDNGTDERTHYIGLISNQGGFFRGCANQPPNTTSIPMASGPAGPPTGANVPINATGDSDASFADWYGGHELGHTFDRSHPGFCNKNSKDDLAFPYPNGQISDGSPGSFSGLDVGDSANSIPLAVLWGATTFDMMTYCNQPTWPSAYTYEGIRHQLLVENPNFPLLAIGDRLPRTLLTGPLVHVVARVNLTRKTGSIDYVAPVSRALPSSAPSSRAELVFRDSVGAELARMAASLQETTDQAEGEDRVALIDASAPFQDAMAEVDLELDGVVLDSFKSPPAPPPTVSGIKIGHSASIDGLTVAWSATPAAAGHVLYTVQAPAGQGWTIIATGLTTPQVNVSAAQAAAGTLRAIASNGFRNAAPVTINLCPQQAASLLAAQRRADDLAEALDNGEIPPPPRTPQRIAAARAQLASLRRAVGAANAQLSQCWARNP